MAAKQAKQQKTDAISAEKLLQIIETFEQIGREKELRKLFRIIPDKARAVMDWCDRFTLYLRDRDKEELFSIVAQDLENMKEIRLSFGKGLAGACAASREIIVVNDVSSDTRFNKEIDRVSGYQTSNTVCYPIVDGSGFLWGVLQVLNNQHGDFSKDDLTLIRIIASQLVIAFRNIAFVKEMMDDLTRAFGELNELKDRYRDLVLLLERKERMVNEDLQLAQAIQQSIITADFEHPRVRFFAHYRPLEQVGGDYFNISSMEHIETVRVFLVDAVGHGVQGALSTMIIQSEYNNIKELIRDPGEVLSFLNNSFVDNYLNLYFTAVLLDIDFSRSQIRLACGGHPSPIFLKPDGETVVPAEEHDPLVGLEWGLEYQTFTLPLEAGTRILMYSDGITDSLDEENQEGDRILAQLFATRCRNDLETCLCGLQEKSDASKNIGDDRTLLGVELLPASD